MERVLSLGSRLALVGADELGDREHAPSERPLQVPLAGARPEIEIA
jgi:hypothetical protein